VNISQKFILGSFVAGIVIGLGVSPWADQKPQEVLTSPLSHTYAHQLVEEVKPKEVLPKKSTMEQYFAYFDQEQGIGNNEAVTVLGDHTSTTQISQKSGKFTIAILGDSMVDTMGTDLPYLRQALEKHFPNTEFNLLNYGIGAENIEAAKPG
jgi:ABC-type proline/glycine betaine transport system ATPase subunit